MPTFRCPKCRTQLIPDSTKPTVNCAQCGQLCVVPALSAALARSPAMITSTLPDDDVMDVTAVPPGDDDVMDVVAADGRRKGSRKSRNRRSRSSGDEVYQFVFLSGFNIMFGILFLGGIALAFLATGSYAGSRLLLGYGIALTACGSIWMWYMASEDGELLFVAFVPFYAFVYALNRGEDAIKAIIVQASGGFFMGIALYWR